MFTCKQPSNTLIVSSKPIKGSSINETFLTKNDLYDFLPEIFTFKHEYITNNRKIKEEFIIQGNEIISNVNNEETIKEFFKKCSNYAIIL